MRTSGVTPARPRILYLSALPALDSTSGALLIHRHLHLAEPRFQIYHAHDDAAMAEDDRHFRVPEGKFYRRLLYTRWYDQVWRCNQILGWSPAPGFLDRLCDRIRPDLLVTVAEGSFMAACRRLAQRRRLPLVTFFHDWSPCWLPAPPWMKRWAGRQVRRLHRASRVSLCVSRGIRERLGGHGDAWILPPIPGGPPRPPSTAAAPFHLAYAGVFHNIYRAELSGLVGALAERGEAGLLQIYGPRQPDHGPLAAGTETARQIYAGFLKGPPFEAALDRASVLFVISPFEAQWRDIALCSFPSKIPEYCRFGKPILIWGPPGSTAIEWAERTGAALAVSERDPQAVIRAVHRLRDDAALRQRLAAEAARAGADAFHWARLQERFEHALDYALGSGARPAESEIT